MKFMNFDDDVKVISINNFSKSLFSRFNRCQREAWNLQRNYIEAEGLSLSIGKAAHEYFAQRVSKLIGNEYKPSLPYSPSILKEAKELAYSIDIERLTKNSEVLFIEKRVNATLPNKNNIIGIFDNVLYCEDEYMGDFIKVVDFKSGFSISREVDDEALIYGYLAAKEYKMPVVFARISGRSGDYWEHYFTYEEAMEYEDILNSYTEEVKKVLESPEAPFPNAGAHCQNCPFLDDCINKGYYEDNLDDMITQQALFAAKAKELKDKIKERTISEGGSIESDIYKTKLKESKTFKVQERLDNGKKKTVNKKAFIQLLFESGNIESILSSLDIKYNQDVLDKAEALGFEIGEGISRSIDIQVNAEEVSEDE